MDIELTVAIQTENGSKKVVANSNYKHMYWNMNQQLAHHTVNGCNVNCGDMLASGTISGPEEGSFGSMLEISWSAKNSVPLLPTMSQGLTSALMQMKMKSVGLMPTLQPFLVKGARRS